MFKDQDCTVEKHNALFDECVSKVQPEIMEEVSNKIDEMLKQNKPMFEAAMLRYVQEGANAKSDEELQELTKEHSTKLLAIARKEIEKDLPRWKTAPNHSPYPVIHFSEKDGVAWLLFGRHKIKVLDLEKLPKDN